MKSTIAFSAVIALSASIGCAPARENNGAGGSSGSSGSGGSSEQASGGARAGGSGGSSSSGGAIGQGGTSATSSGGTTTTTTGAGGGAGSAGGAGPAGGASGGAGTTSIGSGGTAGSQPASGGSIGSGGGTTVAGTGGSAGASGTGTAPCDIYQAANTPCVAAHSTVRALYSAYSGHLYQLRRKSDGKTTDVSVSAAGGYVDISVQDTFCTGTSCTISLIYDQSPKKNDLPKAGPSLWMANGSDEADASKGQIKVNGHTAHGIYVDNPGSNVGYRNITTTGLAKGDDPESMYAVLDGTMYSGTCCFDYGNAETSGKDDGSATMEAIYWGNSTQFQKGGAGKGPWIGADLENGMFECDTPGAVCSTNASITWALVTAFLKGPSGNTMGIKAGNAQSGTLQTMWDGKRPPGYTPMKKIGAIILGTGGDGSNYGKGIFFEGCITSGNPPDSVDDAIQANVVAAGYGK